MTTQQPQTVRCPACGRKQPKRLAGESIYYCDNCGGMFDDSPDDGGDYCMNPTRRLEREEEREERRKARGRRND